MTMPAGELPLARVVLASYVTVLTAFAPFVARLGPWYALIAVIALLRIVLGTASDFDAQAVAWLDRLWTGVGFVAGFLFALSWNRAILLRQGLEPNAPLGRRTWRFLLVLVVLATIVAAFGTLVVGVLGVAGQAQSDTILGLVLVFSMLLAAGRMLPALALTAVDYPGWSLLAAFRLTSGHTTTLFLAAVAVVLPALLVRSLLVALATATGDPATETLLRLLATGLTFVAVALGTSLGACTLIALSHRLHASLRS